MFTRNIVDVMSKVGPFIDFYKIRVYCRTFTVIRKEEELMGSYLDFTIPPKKSDFRPLGTSSRRDLKVFLFSSSIAEKSKNREAAT